MTSNNSVSFDVLTPYEMTKLIKQLRYIHEANRIKFKQKHGREAEVADQIKKHQEEVGEFIKAIDGKNDEHPINEMWDCVFSMIAACLNPYQKYSDEEIAMKYLSTLNKIQSRAHAIYQQNKEKC